MKKPKIRTLTYKTRKSEIRTIVRAVKPDGSLGQRWNVGNRDDPGDGYALALSQYYGLPYGKLTARQILSVVRTSE